MAFLGFNFRQALAFDTDGANESCVYPIAGPALQSYPTSFGNGLTAGWVSGGDTSNFRDRNAANDARLAGMWFNNQATKARFRIDLSNGAGTYDIRLALGDDSSGWSHTCALYDGAAGSPFVTITGTTATAQWLDAAGTLRTSAASWVSSNALISRTFSGSYLMIELGDGVGAGPNSVLSHVALQPPAAAPQKRTALLLGVG